MPRTFEKVRNIGVALKLIPNRVCGTLLNISFDLLNDRKQRVVQFELFLSINFELNRSYCLMLVRCYISITTESVRKPLAFRCFQRVQKWNIGPKCVKLRAWSKSSKNQEYCKGNELKFGR